MKKRRIPAAIPALLAAAVLPILLVSCSTGSRDTVTLPESGSPFVAFDIWFRVGSQDDPAGKEGLAALTASMLAEGATRSAGYQEILAELYPMAADYGAGVDKEMTCFTGRIHRDNLDAYYDLLRAAILEPAFDPADFERIKSRTLNELERTRRYARDEELSKELLMWLAFQNTPYAHPTDGYVSSVESITLDDVRDFYAAHYKRGDAVVGVAGGYPDGFAARVRKDFDVLPAGVAPVVPAPHPRPPAGLNVLIVDKDTASTPVSIGFPIPLVRSDPDFTAMMVANAWFGLHRNSLSHLYQVIREARGMNYGDYSYIEAFPRGYATMQPRVNVARRTQLFEIWLRPVAETDPGTLHDRAVFALRAAMRELSALVDRGMTPEEFERTRDFLVNYVATFGLTLSRRLGYAVDDLFYGIGGDGFLAELKPRLEALTVEDVNTAIRRNLQAENAWIVMVTKDGEGMRQLLLSGEPTNITYAGEKPQEQLDEDREIASYPLPLKPENVMVMSVGQVFQ